jgi:hypothetical protein
VPYEILALEAAIREADDFDIIHFHDECLHLPWTRRMRCATVTSMHGRLDLRDLVPLYREYADVPLVSIGRSEKAVALGELARHRVPRPARRPLSLPFRAGRISRLPRPDLPGEAGRPGDRHCPKAPAWS